MQFSLKWLFACSAWVALFCAGFAFPTQFSATITVLSAFALILSAAIGAFVTTAARRAFCVGFAVTAVTVQAAYATDFRGRYDAHWIFTRLVEDAAEDAARVREWLVMQARPPGYNTPQRKREAASILGLIFREHFIFGMSLCGGLVGIYLHRLDLEWSKKT